MILTIYFVWGFFLACCRLRKFVKNQKITYWPLDDDEYTMVFFNFIAIVFFWPLWTTWDIFSAAGKFLIFVAKAFIK
jgi:hypothetical protein